MHHAALCRDRHRTARPQQANTDAVPSLAAHACNLWWMPGAAGRLCPQRSMQSVHLAAQSEVAPIRTRLCTLQVQQVLDQWPRQLDAIRPDGPAATVVSSVPGAAGALHTPAALALVDRWQVPAASRTTALAKPRLHLCGKTRPPQDTRHQPPSCTDGCRSAPVCRTCGRMSASCRASCTSRRCPRRTQQGAAPDVQ